MTAIASEEVILLFAASAVALTQHVIKFYILLRMIIMQFSFYTALFLNSKFFSYVYATNLTLQKFDLRKYRLVHRVLE